MENTKYNISIFLSRTSSLFQVGTTQYMFKEKYWNKYHIPDGIPSTRNQKTATKYQIHTSDISLSSPTSFLQAGKT